MRAAAILFLSMLCITPSQAGDAEADFRDGLSAFNAGDYQRALNLWVPLAQAREARAQAGIGFMYHRGLGVPVDDTEAAMWLQRAAEQGQAEGQLMLGILYFYGSGVTQSYTNAYAWCEMAVDNGQPDGEMCRDAAIQSMAPGEQQKGFDLLNDLRAQFGRLPR